LLVSRHLHLPWIASASDVCSSVGKRIALAAPKSPKSALAPHSYRARACNCTTVQRAKLGNGKQPVPVTSLHDACSVAGECMRAVKNGPVSQRSCGVGSWLPVLRVHVDNAVKLARASMHAYNARVLASSNVGRHRSRARGCIASEAG
jgi:hypothetical protein